MLFAIRETANPEIGFGSSHWCAALPETEPSYIANQILFRMPPAPLTFNFLKLDHRTPARRLAQIGSRRTHIPPGLPSADQFFVCHLAKPRPQFVEVNPVLGETVHATILAHVGVK
jgi:hypothetical protein